MMAARSFGPWSDVRPWAPVFVIGLAVSVVAMQPAPLLPVARAYAALCERFPFLALVTHDVPPLPLALLLSLAGCAFLAGGWSGMAGLLATLRVNRQLRRGGPLPDRVISIARDLGVVRRLTYLSDPEPTACCYGFFRPWIAVSSGLVDRLDDEELTAVLGHEREHLRRRDPLRYLMVGVAAAAAFMFPVAPALRRRWMARSELAADRGALTIASRGALAGALLAVIPAPRTAPGIAGLTSTEARIAQLTGESILPPIPARAAFASLGLACIIVLATVDLAASAQMVRMACPFCSWLP
jgi:Zn-dependent protease with chaperone function